MKNNSTALTVAVLRSIAQHLSGRQSCRGIEYTVCIGMTDTSHAHGTSSTISDTTILFYPERSVFPDRFHRQKSDLQDIINHVLKIHFNETVYDHDDPSGRACFRTSSLVSGVYQYILSVDGRRRQWVRIK